MFFNIKNNFLFNIKNNSLKQGNVHFKNKNKNKNSVNKLYQPILRASTFTLSTCINISTCGNING